MGVHWAERKREVQNNILRWIGEVDEKDGETKVVEELLIAQIGVEYGFTRRKTREMINDLVTIGKIRRLEGGFLTTL